MKQEWRRLTFLHWAYDPAVVQALLPEGLTVDTYDGKAWVALVPFEMMATAPKSARRCRGRRTSGRPTSAPTCAARTAVPGCGSCPWTRPGSARSLPPGSAYSLPYFWSRMRLVEQDDGRQILYVTAAALAQADAASRWSRSGSASRTPPDELTERDHYFTARFALGRTPGAASGGRPADHPAWPLHRAELLHLDDTLVTATGLPGARG